MYFTCFFWQFLNSQYDRFFPFVNLIFQSITYSILISSVDLDFEILNLYKPIKIMLNEFTWNIRGSCTLGTLYVRHQNMFGTLMLNFMLHAVPKLRFSKEYCLRKIKFSNTKRKDTVYHTVWFIPFTGSSGKNYLLFPFIHT